MRVLMSDLRTPSLGFNGVGGRSAVTVSKLLGYVCMCLCVCMEVCVCACVEVCVRECVVSVCA